MAALLSSCVLSVPSIVTYMLLLQQVKCSDHEYVDNLADHMQHMANLQRQRAMGKHVEEPTVVRVR